MRRRTPRQIVLEHFDKMLKAHDFSQHMLGQLTLYRRAEWSDETLRRFELARTSMQETSDLLTALYADVQKESPGEYESLNGCWRGR